MLDSMYTPYNLPTGNTQRGWVQSSWKAYEDQLTLPSGEIADISDSPDLETLTAPDRIKTLTKRLAEQQKEVEELKAKVHKLENPERPVAGKSKRLVII